MCINNDQLLDTYILLLTLWDHQLHVAAASLYLIFPTDVAEMVCNRCVTTNEGTKDDLGNEVHATSDTFKVDYNYEFLEDFQDKHSSVR